MTKVLSALGLVLVCGSRAYAQGPVDAESVYLGTYGGTICQLRPGIGAPSGGSTCDVYVTSTGDLYTKRSGTWTLLPRLEAANVFTAAQMISTTEPALYWHETDQGLDLKQLRLDLNAGVLQVQTLSDASAVLATILTLSRAGALAVSSGITAGSGNVNIVNSAGKIPALTSTYIALLDFDAANLTSGALPAARLSARSLVDLGTRSAGDLSSGTLLAARMPALTGDVTSTVGTVATTLASGSASVLNSGNLAYARMPSGSGTWTANPTISGTFATTGKVGIGTAVSAYALDVQAALGNVNLQSTTGTFSAYLQVQNTSGGLFVGVDNSAGGNLATGSTAYAGIVSTYVNKPLQFGTNNTIRLTILGTGEVGIGMSPSRALDVTGTFGVTSTATFTANVNPSLNYVSNLGSLSTKYLTLHAAELWVETLVAQSTIATIGGRVLVAPTSPLCTDLAPATTFIDLKYNQAASGDRIYLEANGKVEWMALGSQFTTVTCPDGSTGYRYNVTRNLDGSGANQWYAGDAMLNTGVAGKGFIDLYSTSGVLSGSGPTIVGNVRTGTTYSDVAARWAIGNCDGLYGYSGSTVCAAFGDATAANLTIDATNGIRIRAGSTVYADLSATTFTVGSFSGNNYLRYNGTVLTWKAANTTLDASGNLTAASATLSGALTATSLAISGAATIGTGGSLASGATAFGTGTGYWLAYNAGTPQFRVGTTAGNRLAWDGTDLTLASASVSLDASGVSIVPATTTGYVNLNAYRFTATSTQMGLYGFDDSGKRTIHLLVKDTRAATGSTNVQTSMEATSNTSGGNLNTAAVILIATELANSSSIDISAKTINIGVAGGATVGLTGAMTATGAVEGLGLRATGSYSATTGAGLELAYFSGSNRSRIISFDRTGSAYKDLYLEASRYDFSQGGIVVGAPTGGNKGAGTINAVGVYDDNVLLTDAIFDLHYDGFTTLPHPGRLYSLAEVQAVTETEHRLPWMPTKASFAQDRVLGGMVTRLWQGQEQQQLYFFDLGDRIAAQDARIVALEQALARVRAGGKQ